MSSVAPNSTDDLFMISSHAIDRLIGVCAFVNDI